MVGSLCWRLLVACAAAWVTAAGAGDGSWRKEFPPWGEPGLASGAGPEVWLPIMGPFTNHGCFPSRYMSMRIAVSHVNRRDATFCPAIAGLVNDFELRYDIKDTGGSGVGAAGAVLEYFLNSTVRAMVKVFLGPNGSGASKASSSILSVFGIPQISWASTSADLSNKATYPQFFRTVSPDSSNMDALAGLISSLGFTKVHSVHFDATFQQGQGDQFAMAAERLDMQVFKYAIPNSGESGKTVSATNRLVMNSVLRAIQVSDCRVVAAFCMNEEAWDLFSAAHDMGLVSDQGWLWFGADGIQGNQLLDDVNRLYAFVGAIYVFPFKGTRLDDYAAKWALDMNTTSTPEFNEMALCIDHSGNSLSPTVCAGNADFTGWTDEYAQELKCTGYTPFAYDAVVTLAVVADELFTKNNGNLDDLTASDWLEEMRKLSEANRSFDCLSGRLTYNENQERLLSMDFLNWQSGSMSAARVATWSLADGYVWEVGQEVQWPGGTRAVIASPTGPPALPSGTIPSCGASEYYDSEALECTAMCPAGEEPTEAGGCQACAAGMFKPSPGQHACQNCSAGTAARLNGSQRCGECGPGTFSGAEGQEECALCEAGRFAALPASTSCLDCSAGKVSGEPGADACGKCPVGYYQELSQQSECAKCPAGITLEWTKIEGQSRWVPFEGASTAAACGCAAGTRMVEGGQCESCGEASDSGLLCRGKDDIVIAEGFYAEDSSLSVFKCFGMRKRCKGGPAGQVCAANREGLTCDHCLTGMQEQTSGECKPCQGWSAALVVGAVICCLIVLLLVYIAIDRRGTTQPTHVIVLCGLTVSIAITVWQQIGIVGMIEKIDWEEPLDTIMQFAQIINFDIDLLHLNCVLDSTPVRNFMVRVSMLFFFVAVLIAYHVIGVIAFYNSDFRSRLPTLYATIGTITHVFYIAVITTVIGPFQCLQNPNGRWTVREYQSVVCWESASDDQAIMLSVGVVALLFPLAYLAKCCHVVKIFPASMQGGHVSLLKSYSFLFFRYTTECYWYSLVHMFRSLLLGLSTVIPNVALQIIIMQGILVIQLICTVFFLPWRIRQASYYDIFSTAVVMFSLGCASFYMETRPGPELAWVMVAGLFVMTLTLLGGVLWKVFEVIAHRNTKPFKFFLCHHKAAAGSCARLLKMQLCSLLNSRRQEVFLDCDDLNDVETLFGTVADNVETLIILCTRGLFMRPWCMGEVVTAFKKDINTVKLVFPDYVDPDEEYICGYQDASPDFSILTRHGYSLADVQTTLRWVPELTSFSMPSELTDTSMFDLVSELQDDSVSNIQSLVSDQTTDFTTWIVHDAGSVEAGATAAVMARMLRKHFVHSPSNIPQTLLKDQDIPESAMIAVVLCTGGALQEPSVLAQVLRVISFNHEVKLFPVTGDDSFRFPSLSYKEETKAVASRVTNNPDMLLSAVEAMFRMIAHSFLANSSSASALKARAAEIACRLETTWQAVRTSDARGRPSVSSSC